MAFRLPTFNLTCNIWQNVGAPLTMPPPGPPTFPGVPCQLRVVWTAYVVNATGSAFWRMLLLPALTDIRPAHAGGGQADAVECPAGSGRFYNVLSVEDQHKGFPNEYRFAVLNTNPNRAGYWPTPTP